jgi:hypothetical protein
MSARQDAINELVNRLTGITIAEGFSTDAGASVLLGEQPTFGPADAIASIAVVIGADEPKFQAENVLVDLPVAVQLYVKAGESAPWNIIEGLISDVKTAVETDHNLSGTLVHRGLVRGSVTPMDRETGSEFVGAVVEYRLQYLEGWGSP